MRSIYEHLTADYQPIEKHLEDQHKKDAQSCVYEFKRLPIGR